MPVEFMSSDKVARYFGEEGVRPTISYHRGGEEKQPGYYTDDTALTICLAESLIEKGFDIKDQFSKYQKWFREGYATPFEDQAFGVGQNTLWTLIGTEPEDIETKFEHNEKKGGNGALMRCSPIGLRYYANEQELVENTLKSTITTHNNGMAVWTSIAHNLFISYALNGLDKRDFIKKFLSSYPEAPAELKDALETDFSKSMDEDFKTTGYTLNTFIISTYIFMNTDNYTDCVTKAILIGGDTDTQGAVVGALAGAYYGLDSIPEVWKKTLLRNTHIESLAVYLHSKTTS